jgi:hypothetical protein
LHFRVLGYIALPLPLWPELPLSVTGEFPEGTLPALIDLERGDALFFPAQWPETYSYTLTAALDSGLPIVATNLGAFPERLSGVAHARVLDWNDSAARFNDALLALLGAPRSASPPAPRVSPSDYADWYAAALRPVPVPADPIPALEEALLSPPSEIVPQPTLVGLYDDGVLCGSGSSRAELRVKAQAGDEALARVAELEPALRAADASLDEARARIATLEAQAREVRAALESAGQALAAARDWHERILASSSWRFTAPLRAIARWLRRS